MGYFLYVYARDVCLLYPIEILDFTSLCWEVSFFKNVLKQNGCFFISKFDDNMGLLNSLLFHKNLVKVLTYKSITLFCNQYPERPETDHTECLAIYLSAWKK